MKVSVAQEYVIGQEDTVELPALVPSLYEQEQPNSNTFDKSNTISILKLWIKECEKFRENTTDTAAAPGVFFAESFKEWYAQEYLSKQPPGLNISLLDYTKRT